MRIYGYESDEKINIISASDSTFSWSMKSSFNEQLRALKIYLHYNLINNYNNFIKTLEEEISKLDIILLLNGNVYGFVSSSYCPTDQLKFRKQFIELCLKKDSRFDFTNSIIQKKNGRITEIFKYDNSNGDIEVKCGLVYGKNNGHGSYSVIWTREFRGTSAKILPFKSDDNYNWQNNPRIINHAGYDILSFVESITQEGVKIMTLCDEIILNAKNHQINNSIIMNTFDIILDRVLVAKASKERVKQYYNDIYNDLSVENKDNIWAISHALCFTGTHNNAIPFSMKDLLIKTGTELLDEGYEKFNDLYKKNEINLQLNY